MPPGLGHEALQRSPRPFWAHADKDKHLATKDWGAYGFVLSDVRRIKPIPAKGKLNFWEFKKT